MCDGDGGGDGSFLGVDVRMIDFAHVQLRGEEGEGKEGEEGEWEEGDVNYLYGLTSLLEHLKALRVEVEKEEEEEEKKGRQTNGKGEKK